MERSTVFGFAVGAVLGAIVTWMVVASLAEPVPVAAGGPVDRVASPTKVDAVSTSAPSAPSRDAAATTPEAPGRPTDAERAPADVVTPELLAFARDGIRDGWRQVRSDAIPDDVLQELLVQFEAAVRALPASLGQEVARARMLAEKKAAALGNPDPVALLAAIEGTEPDAIAFVQSDRFASLFVRRGSGTSLDGTTVRAGQAIPAGGIVAFPAGVFHVGDLASGNEPFPDDVTVRGVGMDATLLVVDAIRARSAIRRLSLEDCTLFANDGLVDLRSEPAAISLLRVRVVGFDCGAGGSYAMDTRAVAIHASECRFESGYGRSPNGYANLLRGGGTSLLRFDRCVFERVDLAGGDAPTAVFVECAFADMLGPQPRGPVFRGCRWSTIPADKTWDADYRRRDLNVLFPDWQQRLQGR